MEFVFRLTGENSGILPVEWKKFFYQPLYVFELYEKWLKLLFGDLRAMNFRMALLTPLVMFPAVLIVVVWVFSRKHYSFHLWYVLNHRFATLKDVKNMGLAKEMFMVLGRFGSLILSVRPSESVLCVGEMGTGKTSSVAIPSVLHSDNACIIAVDMTGLLPKYTAGYRARLGEVFYYNWDLLDEPDKGIFYPRWNPLARENMPKEQVERDLYLRRIAGYLADIDDTKRDDYWNLLFNN